MGSENLTKNPVSPMSEFDSLFLPSPANWTEKHTFCWLSLLNDDTDRFALAPLLLMYLRVVRVWFEVKSPLPRKTPWTAVVNLVGFDVVAHDRRVQFARRVAL